MSNKRTTQRLEHALTALIAIITIFSCKSPYSPRTSYSLSGMVYYSTTPIDGLELILDTCGECMTTITKGGFYHFENIKNGGCLVLKNFGWHVNTYALRPVFTPMPDDTNGNVTIDLYVYKLLPIIYPRWQEKVRTRHPKISWGVIPEAETYEINLFKIGDMDKPLEVGITSEDSYVIIHELDPGEYSFTAIAYDAFNHIVADAHFADYLVRIGYPFYVSY